MSRAWLGFLLCGVVLFAGTPTAAADEASPGKGTKMHFPYFTEVASSGVERENHLRSFDVIFPGFEVTGVFKWIRIKDNRLDMAPADGEQLHFQPTKKPVTSRVFLVADGEITPELVAKP